MTIYRLNIINLIPTYIIFYLLLCVNIMFKVNTNKGGTINLFYFFMNYERKKFFILKQERAISQI